MHTETKAFIAILAISLVIAVAFQSPAKAEIVGNKYCYQGWLIPGIIPLWICNNEDGGMDHSFLTEQAMRDYYVPPLTETLPQYTFVEGSGTETYTP